MKAPEQQPAESGDIGPEDVREERNGRGPVVVLSVLGLVGAWRLVVSVPEVAYIVVGSLGTVGVQKVRARLAGRGGGDDGEDQEAELPDVADALRRLVGQDKGVLLTALRDDLKLPDTKVVKQLLDGADIPWKAVRTPRGNGPGVHKNDIPTVALSPVADIHGNGCCCRSDDNGNSDNTSEGGPGEGIRVERTDSGLLIRNLNDAGRHGSAREEAS